MRNPEYIKLTYPELKELAKTNWRKPEILCHIGNELNYRSHKYSSWLKTKIWKRLEILEYITDILQEPKSIDETKAIVHIIGAIFEEAFYPLNETTIEEVVETIEQARQTVSSPIDRKLVSQFAPSEKFKGNVIGMTGITPVNEATLRAIIHSQGGFADTKGIFVNCPIIVIGRQDFDENYLRKAITTILEKNISIQFLSQEDFFVYLLTGVIAQYAPNDPRILSHLGLTYLSTIGFRWPQLRDPNYYGYSGNGDRYANRQLHPLNTLFGYTVKNQTPKDERQERLRKAVLSYPLGLGLQEVVTHIAALINEFSQTQPDRMENAIFAWKQDLNWLKATYYDRSIYRFVWPSI